MGLGTRRGIILPMVLAAVALAAPPAATYNDDGHFYSIIASGRFDRLTTRAPTSEEAKVAAFCAQIPDMASELEAVTLRAGWRLSFPTYWAWGTTNLCLSENVRHMVTVHQYVHALTNSAAEPVTRAAVKIIKQLRQGETGFDPNRACAMGFGLHLLGDSFAHRRLQDRRRLYKPGRGHALDGHDPDFIALDLDRAKLWADYLNTLSDALGLRIDPEQWNAIKQVALHNLEDPAEKACVMDTNVKAFMKLVSEPEPDQSRTWAPYSPRVDRLYPPGTLILTKTFADVVSAYRKDLPPGAALDYRTVWAIYLRAAVQEFQKEGIDVYCSPEDPPR